MAFNLSSIEARLAAIRKLDAVAAIVRFSPGPVYLVGGSVRDLLLDRDIKDFDLVLEHGLEAACTQVAAMLGVRAVPMGRPPLQVFRLSHDGLIFDICPLEGQDIISDLKRRDLTINAMALRLFPENGPLELIDPCGGLEDLENRHGRFVSEGCLVTDPVRLLRFFRICAVLGLTPAQESLNLVKKHAKLITESPGERLRVELLDLLQIPSAHPFIRHMLDQGLLEAIIPSLTPLRDLIQGDYHHLDALEHTLETLAELEDILAGSDGLPNHLKEVKTYLTEDYRPALLKLATLLHDLGKAATLAVNTQGRVCFHGHEKISGQETRKVTQRLKMSAAETELVHFLVVNHMRVFHLFEAYQAGTLSAKGVFRFGRLAGPNLFGLILLTVADAAATRGSAQEKRGGRPAIQDFINKLLEVLAGQQSTLAAAPRLVTGNDLMAELEIGQSPLVGRVLLAIQEAQALGQIKTKEEALALARVLAVSPI